VPKRCRRLNERPHIRGVVVVARALVTVVIGLIIGTPDAAHALNIGGPGVTPDDFRITTFASGLNFPYGMQVLSDGSLLVATSNPVDPSNPSFFNSVGELIRLVDSNGDGSASTCRAAGTARISPGSTSVALRATASHRLPARARSRYPAHWRQGATSYELYANDTYTRLATSNPFGVTP